MKLFVQLLCALVLLIERAQAGTVSALLGPPSLGQGGSNPVSIPPGNVIDWQASYRTDSNSEWMVSVVPGIYYGQRFTKERLTLGLGGGLLIGVNGVGLGLYQSLGFATQPFWKKYRLEAEYRQIIGYTEAGVEFPYTLRIGVSYEI
jgi:hypothetical protein